MSNPGFPILATLSLEPLAPVMFYAMAALAIVSGWAIVVSRHIVRMALYLLLTLIGVAGLYFLLNNEFLAAIQLIVYAGGTLILIVFGVMLTAKNPAFQIKAEGAEWWLGLTLGLVMAGLLGVALLYSPAMLDASAKMAPSADVRETGQRLLTTFLVPFEMAGVLLLVVMVAAAYMARHRSGDETK